MKDRKHRTLALLLGTAALLAGILGWSRGRTALKRRQPSGPSALAPQPAATDHIALATLAENVWRLERRAQRNDPAPWLTSTIERLQDCLRELKVEIIDPLGRPYVDGQLIEVLHTEAPPEWRGPLVITETIAPVIRIEGRVWGHGKVVLGPAEEVSEGEGHAG